MTDTLLTTEDLARLLHMTPKALLNRRSMKPDSVPPSIKIPGARKPLWHPEDVERWINARRPAQNFGE